MEIEGDSDPIPVDIILDILSRLSVESIARFGLASKFCASILTSQDFTESFLKRSLTSEPRLLFAVKNSNEWRFYTSPQLQNPDKNNSLVVSADFHMKLRGDIGQEICGPVSGLLYLPNMKRGEVPAICNPSTGQYTRLPQLKRKRDSRTLLGYDPIGKRYKASTLRNSLYGASNDEEGQHILTLGTKNVSWRQMYCPEKHYPIGEGVCINGVLYYIAGQGKGQKIDK
ncbi:putative F-box protein At5g52620 [Capsella rubella]|uniref:putative F-box protein At5g52620 n=1 Tax=Capsella rubella TaxID=81985 RepID=UPI000CD49D1B|nr:putative F-box protein At5g52620 [Capsella rubella]